MTRPTANRSPRRSLIALLLGTGIACTSTLATAQTADEIAAANIAATGGEEALARIENVTSKGRVTIESPFFGKLEGTLDVVSVPGRGYFESAVLGPISQQKGWNGERSWERGPMGLRMLEGFEHASLAIQSFQNMFVALRRLAPAGLAIERLEDAELNGRPHYVLGIESDGAPQLKVYLDKETDLVSRSTVTVSVPNLGEAPVVTDVAAYAPVEGVMLPTSMTIVVEGISTTHVTVDSTVVNTTVDASLFAPPVVSN